MAVAAAACWVLATGGSTAVAGTHAATGIRSTTTNGIWGRPEEVPGTGGGTYTDSAGHNQAFVIDKTPAAAGAGARSSAG